MDNEIHERPYLRTRDMNPSVITMIYVTFVQLILLLILEAVGIYLGAFKLSADARDEVPFLNLNFI